MPSTRSKETNDSSTKPKKIITRNATCVDLCDYSEIRFCCSCCKNRVNVFASTRIKHHKSNELLHLQPWNERFVTDVTKTIFNLTVCEHLDIVSNIELEDEFKCKNKSASSLVTFDSEK